MWSSSCGCTPSPTDSAPCGSKSTSSTRRPYSASAAPRLIVEVVLPTPPFWLHIATTRAGPWWSAARAPGSAGRPAGAADVVVGSARHGATSPAGRRPRRTRRAACAVSSSGWSDRAGRRARAAGGRTVSACAAALTLCLTSTSSRRADALSAGDRGAGPKAGDPRLGARSRRCKPARAGWHARSRRSAAGARMRRRVDLAQRVHGDQRVDLRRRHRRVAEQLLDDADVGAAVEQVGREASAAACAARPPRVSPARSAAARSTCQALCRDSRPPRALRNSAGLPGPRARGPAAHGPGRRRRRRGRRPTGTSRCLPPLPRSSTAPRVEVEVVDVEPDGLGDPGAGAVQHLEQRAVAQRRAAVAGVAAASSSRSTSSTGIAFGSRVGGAAA